MGNGIIIKVLGDTTVTFASLLESPETTVNLKYGRSLVKITKLKAGSKFTVKTPNLFAAVRGTTFLVFNEKKRSSVAVGHGNVAVEDIKKKETVEVKENNAVVVTDRVVKRRISELESLYIKKIEKESIIPNAANVSRDKIESLQHEKTEEGEKGADAATRLVGDTYVCVSWQGGCKAVSKTDWTPLKGRAVTVWPDADEPGLKTAETVKACCIAVGATPITMVNPPKSGMVL